MRSINTLYEENENLEKLLRKKENEIDNIKLKILKNNDLIKKKTELKNRIISVKVLEVKTEYLDYKNILIPKFYTVKIQIIKTSEIYSFTGRKPYKVNQYFKITKQFLESLKENEIRKLELNKEVN